MKPIPFEETNTEIAKDQPEYQTLPAYVCKDKFGTVVVCWKLDWSERIALLLTGKLWHSIWTFGNKLQPVLLSVDKPNTEIMKLNELLRNEQTRIR